MNRLNVTDARWEALFASQLQQSDAPTAQAVARLAELTAELDGQLAELDRVLATELAAFNELVRSKGAPAVLVPSSDKAPPQR